MRADTGAALTFEDWTVARYNRTIAAVARLKRGFGFSVFAAVLIGVAVSLFLLDWDVSNFYGRATYAPIEWFVILWLLPLPLMLFRGWSYLRWYRPTPLPEQHPPAEIRELHRVIFQITSTGFEAATVVNTARSVFHWMRTSRPAFNAELQLVLEPAGYDAHREVYDKLAKEGAILLVVPQDFTTANGSVRKSRALQYAVEVRRTKNYDATRTWIYHQDDETAIGEDTLAGIEEFIRLHPEPAVGTGIILYPQHAEDWRPTAVADLNRTKDDIASLYSLTGLRGNAMTGFHGSHYIVRCDVEDAIGFDAGAALSVVDDLAFEVKTRQRFGNIFFTMRGFAYEQSPFTLRDQIKQRRRWVVGLRAAEAHLPMSATRKFMLGYGLASWACASASTFSIILPLIFNFSVVLPLGFAFVGLVWGLMINGYVVGYTFHKEYVPRKVSIAHMIRSGVIGAAVDSVAVWVGLLAKNGGAFHMVRKDRRVH